eukprot:82270-Pleurochrysis_carterae.AAC.2
MATQSEHVHAVRAAQPSLMASRARSRGRESCAEASRIDTKTTPRDVACRATLRPLRERRAANRKAGSKSMSE